MLTPYLVEQARDLRKENAYTPLTIGHYLRNMGKLAEQYFEKLDNYKDQSRQRVYLKDIDCPDVWHDKLREHLPPNLFYLNESTGETAGPGSVDEPVPTGGKRKGRGIAGAGDLMSSLPAPMRAQNMMCYIGHEGTYTPAHREMCASLGHNIMVEVSDILGDDGKPERPGSSIWFMTETKDRHSAAEYWLSILGHDIEVEKHFAQVAAWKRAPFTTYVVEQKAGDFILIPPMAPHQVWNRGTRTMKAAWNRTTVETLEMAFNEALPNARTVCRDEQYKNKAIVFYSLQKYAGLLAKARDQQQTAPSPQEAAALRTSPKIRQLQKDFKRLFNLFKGIMLSEMYSPENPHERNVEFFPYDSNITCAYCRGNIFNKFLTCKTCDDMLGTDQPEPYDICMDCYAMGRSCGCISKMRWAEQFKWKELAQKYEHWRRVYIELEGGQQKPDSPLTLAEERNKLGKKTLAQVCQEQLKRRPWFDVHKKDAKESDGESEEIEINEAGTVKKKKKKRSEAWLKNHHTCHVCCHRHDAWKMAECSCGRKWCYGTLFRGFDTMPQEIMEDANWKCPHCRGMCFAGACRKDPRQNPYEPKGTLLGHDTKKVADVRSVESLVDFGVSNLNWLKETIDGPTNPRLEKRQQEADREKENDVTLDAHYASDFEDAGHQEGLAAGISYSTGGDADDSAIDPALRGAEDTVFQRPNARAGLNLAALLNRDNQDTTHSHDGYQPAQQHGYVAPSAVMFNAPDAEGDEEEDFGSYPDVNEEGARSKKRKRASDGDVIKRLPVKKRRPEDRESLPASTKQYRKEQDRKALEQARKAGRFIQMHAVLRGKSRLVKLKIGRENMLRIAEEQAAKEAETHNDLLKSDIAPPETATRQAADASNKSKTVRVRVEPDQVFDPRHRRRDRNRSSMASTETSRPKKRRSQYEEFDIESDVYSDDDDVQADGIAATGTDRKERKSAWQSKRQEEGDEDVPAMLPNDYKDRGRDRIRKSVGGASNNTTPASKAAGARKFPTTRAPPTAPVVSMKASKDPITIEDASGDDDDSVLGDNAAHTTAGSTAVDSDTIQVSTAAAALRQQHEDERNHQVKLHAGDAAGDSGISEDEDDEMAGVKGVATSFGSGKPGLSTGGAKTVTPKAKPVAQAQAGVQNGFMAANR